MAFSVPPSHYDQYMGRWSRRLAPMFAEVAGVAAGDRVLDVGCGPGALTAHLATLVGADHVAAIDPSPSFVAGCRSTVPGADVRDGAAEDLPWPDDRFDAVLSQLVLTFVRDAPAAAAQMTRVTRPGGLVAAVVWDYAAMGMLRLFWEAARSVVPAAPDEADALPFGSEESLQALFEEAGLVDVSTSALTVSEEYADAQDCWEPLTLGVGPAGDFARSLDPARLTAVREAFESRVPSRDQPFRLQARARVVTGRRP